jgi:hypothetical protein
MSIAGLTILIRESRNDFHRSGLQQILNPIYLPTKTSLFARFTCQSAACLPHKPPVT